MLLSENVYSVSVWRYRIFKSSQTDLENRKLNIYILIIINNCKDTFREEYIKK